MNLLAHLHVGDRLSPVAAAGNLTADFCRERGSHEYYRGVQVHQAIDLFTDTHPVVLAARPLFPGKLRRFAPIILDLVFDYCLSKSWSQWHHDSSRETFISTRLDNILHCPEPIPAIARQFIHEIKQNQLLENYDQLDGVIFSMQRIVARRSRFAPMLEAIPLLESRTAAIQQTFQIFYPALLAHIAHLENELN